MKGNPFVPHRAVQFAPGRFGHCRTHSLIHGQAASADERSPNLRQVTARGRHRRGGRDRLSRVPSPWPNSLGTDFNFCSIATVGSRSFNPSSHRRERPRFAHSGSLQSRRAEDIADSGGECRSRAASDPRLNGGNRRDSRREGRQRLGVRPKHTFIHRSTNKLSRRAESEPKRIASGRTVARHGRRRVLGYSVTSDSALFGANSDAALVQ
jgi:hypothetical protein